MNPKSTASIAGHPLHPMLIPFPIAFFVGTLAVDLAYSRTADAFWATASTWMLGAGLVMAGLAAVAGFTDFFGERRIRALRAVWLHMVGNLVVVLLEGFNLWGRLADGPAFIPAAGLLISLGSTMLLLFNGWMGWEMVYRHRVGVADATHERPN